MKKMMLWAASIAAACGLGSCGQTEVPPTEGSKTGFALSGCRAYLAVNGGIDVPRVMGSRATMIGKSFGGFEGRRLEKGDVLGIRGGAGSLPHQETYFTPSF